MCFSQTWPLKAVAMPPIKHLLKLFSRRSEGVRPMFQDNILINVKVFDMENGG